MANNMDVKDAAGLTKTMKTTDTAGVHVPSTNVDNEVSAIINSTTPVNVRGNTTRIRPVMTVSATPDYAIGDVVGGKITITNAVREPSGSALLQDILFWCDDVLSPAPDFDILFFNADLVGSTTTDNGPLTLSTADKAKVTAMARVVAGDWRTLSTDMFAEVQTGVVLKANGTQHIYMVIVTNVAMNLSGTAVMYPDLGLLRD